MFPRNFWRFFFLTEPRPCTIVSAAALERLCITTMSLGGGPPPSTGSTPTPRWWNRFFLLLGNIVLQSSKIRCALDKNKVEIVILLSHLQEFKYCLSISKSQ